MDAGDVLLIGRGEVLAGLLAYPGGQLIRLGNGVGLLLEVVRVDEVDQQIDLGLNVVVKLP
jgi:hypothetical protein